MRQKVEIRNQKSRVKKTVFLIPIFLFLISVFLFSCASSKLPEMSKIQMQAVEFNQRGVHAVESESYDKALIEFQKSLKLNTSIDNQNGVAINLLNLGRLYLLVSRFDDARVVFDKAINVGISLNDPLILSEGYAS